MRKSSKVEEPPLVFAVELLVGWTVCIFPSPALSTYRLAISGVSSWKRTVPSLSATAILEASGDDRYLGHVPEASSADLGKRYSTLLRGTIHCGIGL